MPIRDNSVEIQERVAQRPIFTRSIAPKMCPETLRFNFHSDLGGIEPVKTLKFNFHSDFGGIEPVKTLRFNLHSDFAPIEHVKTL